jgi:glutamine amidotransferase
MIPTNIAILDYGLGNHGSVFSALTSLGYRVKITNIYSELDSADVLLLPGVGAFSSAMKNLKLSGLGDFIKDYAKKNRPLIGICLGMQLLATSSEEHQYTKGLNLIPGEIIPFKKGYAHIGWNTIKQKNPVFLKLKKHNESFYFNHSFYFKGSSKYHIATSYVNDTLFPSIIKYKKIVGIQFHPEKSQSIGRDLLFKTITKLTNA